MPTEICIFEIGSHYIVQAGLELIILLSAEIICVYYQALFRNILVVTAWEGTIVFQWIEEVLEPTTDPSCWAQDKCKCQAWPRAEEIFGDLWAAAQLYSIRTSNSQTKADVALGKACMQELNQRLDYNGME